MTNICKRVHIQMTNICCSNRLGAGNGNLFNWEHWWLPSGQFLHSSEDDEYFTFIISPDCSSCELTQNTQDNYLSDLNTDSYGNRTAYYMTGPMFGCLSVEKAKKDCMWDTDTYECSLCDYTYSDEGIGAINCTLYIAQIALCSLFLR